MTAEFKPVEWAYSTNIYEINVRQYTSEGTFNAFAAHLPRLREMGVETLWFMPIHPIGEVKRLGTLGSYYSIKDYTAINPEFGTLADFKALVQSAQSMGFKVIIDWVANHTSWDHVWTKTHSNFFVKGWDGNFVSPYDWADVIQINHESIPQQDAMIEAMKFWVNECNLDGFRCDMAHLIPLNFWRRARKELDAIKPLFWLAETEEPAYHDVFDASYAWEFLHKMEQYWRRETDIGGLDYVLNAYSSRFPQTAQRAFFTSNHDENSHSGSEYERIGDAAKVFAAICATWNSVPLVYSGQELPNKKRLKFFDKDVIDWQTKNELHDFYKILLQLHKQNPALRTGDPSVSTNRLHTTDGRIFAFVRKNGDNKVLVIANLSSENIAFQLTDQQISGKYSNVFTGIEIEANPVNQLNLNGWDFLVAEKRAKN